MENPQIESLVQEGEKEQIGNVVRECYKTFMDKTRELTSMYEEGIIGLEKKVKNPNYETNGNGSKTDEYCYDFLAFHQAEGVQFLIDNKKILIADEMGTGKTAQAIAGKIELENRLRKKIKTLIVCPNTMKGTWHHNLYDYVLPERSSKIKAVVIGKCRDIKKKSDILEYDEDFERIKDADFVIVNYDALSFSKGENKGNKNKKNLNEQLLEAGFDYIILDEVHNTKNLSAFRSEHIKQLADKSEYLALLSGTPNPNSFKDSHMLVSLLEPKYTTKEVERLPSPVVAALIRSRRKLRRLEEIMSLPEKKEIFHSVEIDGLQRSLYNSILDNGELEGMKKLQQLRKALSCPSLVDKSILDEEARKITDRFETCKYKALDEIIEGLPEGEKIVVYSPLWRTGVSKELEKRYQKYGALRMDGTNADERENIRAQFQKNPGKRILIATDVAGEGIALTAANNIVFLDEPYTPGERKQMIGRCWRPGQSKPVNVYTLLVKDSIDEGVRKFLEAKEKAIEYWEKGGQLSDEQKALFGDKQSIEKWLQKTSLYRYLYTPSQIMGSLVSRTFEKPVEAVGKASKGEFGKHYADIFPEGWKGSFLDNAAEVYKRIIKTLDKEEKLERKIDLASGPGMLSAALVETGICNIDINPHLFETALASDKNKNIVASITNTQLDSGQFDFALCSCGLKILPNTKENPERARAVTEANRLLRTGGYYMTVLSGSSIQDRTNFEAGLEKVGFEPIPELTGFIESTDKKINFFAYIATAKKVKSVNEKEIADFYGYFDLNKKEKARASQKRHGRAEAFVFVDGHEPLEDRIEKYLNKIRI